jgi:hypothetical protein
MNATAESAKPLDFAHNREMLISHFAVPVDKVQPNIRLQALQSNVTYPAMMMKEKPESPITLQLIRDAARSRRECTVEGLATLFSAPAEELVVQPILGQSAAQLAAGIRELDAGEIRKILGDAIITERAELERDRNTISVDGWKWGPSLVDINSRLAVLKGHEEFLLEPAQPSAQPPPIQ